MLTCAGVVSRRAKPDITSVYVPPSSGFTDITAPSGSASLSGANAPVWDTVTGADGYLIYLSTSTQAAPDLSLYSYRYAATGQSTTTRTITGIASGTYYYRVAAYVGSEIGDLSFELQVTAS